MPPPVGGVQSPAPPPVPAGTEPRCSECRCLYVLYHHRAPTPYPLWTLGISRMYLCEKCALVLVEQRHRANSGMPSPEAVWQMLERGKRDARDALK